MTNRLELNWKLDGFVDEQRYYCSQTLIDINNPPMPKAVLAGDIHTYTDTAIEVGKTYYVRVSSVKNSVEKFSEEVLIVAENQGYRYLRIWISAKGNSSGNLQIQEIEIASEVGGADITSPDMIAKESSFWSGNNGSSAIRLIDNIQSTAWVAAIPNQLPQWVSFDLKEKRKISQLKIFPNGTGSVYWGSPKDFKIQVSNNDVDWLDLQAFTNVTSWASNTPKVFNLIDGSYT